MNLIYMAPDGHYYTEAIEENAPKLVEGLWRRFPDLRNGLTLSDAIETADIAANISGSETTDSGGSTSIDNPEDNELRTIFRNRNLWNVTTGLLAATEIALIASSYDWAIKNMGNGKRNNATIMEAFESARNEALEIHESVSKLPGKKPELTEVGHAVVPIYRFIRDGENAYAFYVAEGIQINWGIQKNTMGQRVRGMEKVRGEARLSLDYIVGFRKNRHVTVDLMGFYTIGGRDFEARDQLHELFGREKV